MLACVVTFMLHDVRGRYLDNLVGPYPEAKHIFEERSAMRHVNNISCPILLLQGNHIHYVTQCYLLQVMVAHRPMISRYLLETYSNINDWNFLVDDVFDLFLHVKCHYAGADDKVVLPNQATMMYEAVTSKNIPAAIVIFEGQPFCRVASVIIREYAHWIHIGECSGYVLLCLLDKYVKEFEMHEPSICALPPHSLMHHRVSLVQEKATGGARQRLSRGPWTWSWISMASSSGSPRTWWSLCPSLTGNLMRAELLVRSLPSCYP